MSAQTTQTTAATEHANAIRFRRGNAAFETGDIAALHELWSPDITWTEAGNNAISGVHRGFDNVLTALTEGIGSLDAFAMNLDEVYADDAMSVGLYTMAFTKGGRTVVTRSGLAARLVDGRVTAINAVNMNQAAVDAVMGGTLALPEQGAPTEHVNAIRNREGFAAFQAGNMEALRDLWADDVVWSEDGKNRLAGTHRGFDTVIGMLGEIAGIFGDAWTLRLDGVAADNDCSIARYTGYYGKGLLDQFVMVSYFGRDNKVTEIRVINRNQTALDALIG